MIALVHGRGSLLRRLNGEVVPFGIALVAGSFAGALLGLVGGLVTGVLAWCLASFLLMRIRRRTWMRRTYRTLLFLHVVFWSFLGLTDNGTPTIWKGDRGPSDVTQGQAASFRAGMATARFDLPERTTLAGWGMRPRRRALPAFGGLGLVGRLSQDLMGPPAPGEAARVPMFPRPESGGDALGARALVLLPEGGPSVGIVRLDLIAVDRHLCHRVLRAVTDLGFEESTLLVCATHTHSAPGGALASPLAQVAGSDHFDTGVRDAVVAAAAAALREAAATARPARVAFAASRDRGDDGRPILARDRCRGDDAPVDDRVLAMRFDALEDGSTLGVFLHYAVQPVMLRARHMTFSRDLVGALEDALTEALPGRPPVLFVNGAMGNVSPRRTSEGGAEGARWLAERFAARIAPDVRAAPAIERIRVQASSVHRLLPPGRTFVALGSRAAFHDHVLPSPIGQDAPAVFANVLCLPVNVFVWSLGLPEVRVGCSFDGAVGAAADVGDRASGTCGSLLVEDEEGEARAVLLWQGGLPTAGVGKAWRRAVVTRGLPVPYVLSNTNEALGYVTTPEEYDGRCRYEAQSTLYGRDTGAWLQARLLETVDVVRRAD